MEKHTWTDPLIGFALSDMIDEHKDLRKAISRLKPDMIELQLDDFTWDIKDAKDELEKMSFISVHAASKDLDLSSEDKEMRGKSLQRTLESMDFAYDTGADALVLHPVNNMYLSPTERLESKERFKDIFRGPLTKHYDERGHKYSLCLENIEYPKYPSTLEETLELYHSLSDGRKNIKMTIDIPHVWNSQRILRENPERYRRLTIGFPGEESLSDYVRKFMEENTDKIGLYHIAAFGDNPVRTHEPIYPETMNTEYSELIGIMKKRPILLEIHDQPFTVLEYSKKIMEELTSK